MYRRVYSLYKYVRPHVFECKLLRKQPNLLKSACNNCSSNSTKATHSTEENATDLEKFYKQEKDFVNRLISDYAQPYLSIEEVIAATKKDVKTVTKSPLLNFYKTVNIAKPGLQLEKIKNNLKDIKENAVKRHAALEIDLQRDILQLAKKVKLVSKEIDNYVSHHDDLIKKLNHTEDGEKLDNKDRSLEYSKSIIQLLYQIKNELESKLYFNYFQLPNETHPNSPVDSETGSVLEVIGEKPKFNHGVFDHIYIAEKLNILRQSNIGGIVGQRNYFLTGAGAELEQALVRYTLDKLKKKGFVLISTPNMIRDAVFEGMGSVSGNMKTMVYQVVGEPEKQFCLAGTSEVGLCAYFTNHSIQHKSLPLKVCSLSTCYRKETGTRRDPRGIFRVHQFQKVEMFGVTAHETGEESDAMHQEFIEVQKELLQDLGLHYNVVDMPASDLGLSAYRKVDIEAWFPGRNCYDEVTSASNCTDFQSRRLQILYEKDNKYKYVHTVNATACAAPRLIIALIENGQKHKSVSLPECLVPYMNGQKEIKMQNLWRMRYIGPQQSKGGQVKPCDVLET